jgi:hypothetical protein
VSAEVTIVCPTHGRAGEVTSFATFGPGLLLCVAESQAPAYRAAYPDARLDVHPDSVKGLGLKVIWMAEKYGSFFRVDDDADRMIDHTQDCKIDDTAKARDLVYRLADQARDMGAFMFGFTELVRPVYYSGHAPFRLTGLIEGGKCGFLEGHSIWWPEHISFVDDFWASALNAYHHRFCLVDMRYAIPTQVGQLGGLAGHRTTSQIWEKADFLRTAFGEAVELSDRETFDDTYPWRLRLPWR